MGEFFSKQTFRKEYKMKMSKLALIALVAVGTTFAFTSYGQSAHNISKKSEKAASDPAKQLVEKFLKNVKNKNYDAAKRSLRANRHPRSMKEWSAYAEVANTFEYVKTEKHPAGYVMVCGTASHNGVKGLKISFNVYNGIIVGIKKGWGENRQYKR